MMAGRVQSGEVIEAEVVVPGEFAIAHNQVDNATVLIFRDRRGDPETEKRYQLTSRYARHLLEFLAEKAGFKLVPCQLN